MCLHLSAKTIIPGQRLTYPAIDTNDVKECKWEDFYWKLKESIPPNAPG